MLCGIILVFFSYTQLGSDEFKLPWVFANNRDRENAIHHSKQCEEAVFHQMAWKLRVEMWPWLSHAAFILFWTMTMLACLFSGVTVDATPNWLAASWRLSANLLSATSAAPKFEIFIASHLFGQGSVLQTHWNQASGEKVKKPLFFGQKLQKLPPLSGAAPESQKIVWAAADGRWVAGW